MDLLAWNAPNVGWKRGETIVVADCINGFIKTSCWQCRDKTDGVKR